MSNGYSEAVRIFTKILKSVFEYLRQEGYLSVIFVDDSYLQGNADSECLENIEVTVNLLMKLGFKIHDTHTLKPTQELEFLGFVINFKNMIIFTNKDKSEHIILKIKHLLSDPSPSIRKLASVIGSLIFLFSVIPFGKLHFRSLEKEKTEFLKQAAWNFEAKVSISTFETEELKWWLHAIPNAINNKNVPQVDFEISTDVSEPE